MPALADVCERAPVSPKFVDLTGQVNQYGVEWLRHHGFGMKRNGQPGKICVWVCRCPKCQSEYQEWRTAFARSRGCSNCRNAKDPEKHRQIDRWKRIFRNQMAAGKLSGEWTDRDRFIGDMIEIEDRNTGGRTVIALKPELGLRPGNFALLHRCDNFDPQTINEQLDLFEGGRYWLISRNKSQPIIVTPPPAGIIIGVSRQRIHQLSYEQVQLRLDEVVATGALESLFDSADSYDSHSAVDDVDVAVTPDARD